MRVIECDDMSVRKVPEKQPHDTHSMTVTVHGHKGNAASGTVAALFRFGLGRFDEAGRLRVTA